MQTETSAVPWLTCHLRTRFHFIFTSHIFSRAITFSRCMIYKLSLPACTQRWASCIQSARGNIHRHTSIWGRGVLSAAVSPTAEWTQSVLQHGPRSSERLVLTNASSALPCRTAATPTVVTTSDHVTNGNRNSCIDIGIANGSAGTQVHSMARIPGNLHSLWTLYPAMAILFSRSFPNCFRFLVLYTVYSSGLAVLYLGHSK